MIPDTMVNFFLASTGASAALVGLIFVAISLWPKEQVLAASPAWRAVAGGAFFAFINAFLVSLTTLITLLNPGWFMLILSLVGLSNCLLLGIPLLRSISNWRENLSALIANQLMVLASLAVYGAEGYFGVRLLLVPNDVSAVEGIAFILVCIYTLGLIRAWELLGVEQIGLRRWLNPLQPHARPTHRDEGHDKETRSVL